MTEGTGETGADVTAGGGQLGKPEVIRRWFEGVAAADWAGQGDVVQFQLDPGVNPDDVAESVGNVRLKVEMLIATEFFVSKRQLKTAVDGGPRRIEDLITHIIEHSTPIQDKLIAWRAVDPDGEGFLADSGPLADQFLQKGSAMSDDTQTEETPQAPEGAEEEGSEEEGSEEEGSEQESAPSAE